MKNNHAARSSEAFDRLAATWDVVHGPESSAAYAYRARLAHLRSIVGHYRAPRILDVGCGTGLLLVGLSDLLSLGVGVDLSSRMIERARVNASHSPFGLRLIFHVSAAEMLSSCTLAQFDVVVFCGSLEHMTDAEAVLHEAVRRLAPNGRIVVVMRHPWHWSAWSRRLFGDVAAIPEYRHLHPRALGCMAARAGLSLESIVGLPIRAPLLRRRSRESSAIRGALGPLIAGSYGATFVAHPAPASVTTPSQQGETICAAVESSSPSPHDRTGGSRA